MMGLLLMICLSFAGVDDLMAAKTANQLLQAHRSGEEIEVLHQRCEVELKSSFVPFNCFQWLDRVSLRRSQKIYLENWFDDFCVRVLKKDLESPQFHFSGIKKLRGRCRSEMQDWMRAWAYRAKKEATVELFQKFKVGSQFELEKNHENIQKPDKNKPDPSRSLR